MGACEDSALAHVEIPCRRANSSALPPSWRVEGARLQVGVDLVEARRALHAVVEDLTKYGERVSGQGTRESCNKLKEYLKYMLY